MNLADLQKVRSYREDVLEPITKLVSRYGSFSSEFMGFVTHHGYTHELLCLSVESRASRHRLQDVLISAGVHGEEPASVYTLIRFLENEIVHFMDRFRFLIFPCINPFGFEHNHRFNPDGLDINRQFGLEVDCTEMNQAVRMLSKFGRNFVCTIDLHETDPNWAYEGFSKEDNPQAFYMWELCANKSMRIGHKVIKSVSSIAPICDWPTIYNDTNSGGVIWYPEGCGNPVYAQGTSFDGYLNGRYTLQSFTLETPCGWDLEKRIQTNLQALKTILSLKRDA